MWSVPSRRRAASTERRTFAGEPSVFRRDRSSGWSGSGITPNLLAITTWSRLPASTRPSSSSLAPQPYISAVSQNVTPSSIARSSVAIDCFSSSDP